MKTTLKTPSIKPASIGTVSHGTCRTEDLLSAFADELESQLFVNGNYFCLPENFPWRDRLNNLHVQACDAWTEDGEALEDEEQAQELVNELQDALSEYFAPAYCYFGAHPGDGSDFGFWPDWDAIEELPTAEDSDEGMDLSDDTYSTDFKTVNDHGNVTVRGSDGTVLLELV